MTELHVTLDFVNASKSYRLHPTTFVTNKPANKLFLFLQSEYGRCIGNARGHSQHKGRPG